jgi:rhamnopyranosyl-N-acetylglucosaminyl-diphospho-decaprenol beta-1,3/1,4-galactofuranosyltransferase
MAQPGMRWLRPLETVRFGWFFLVSRRDRVGWREWRTLTRAGRRERLTRP